MSMVSLDTFFRPIYFQITSMNLKDVSLFMNEYFFSKTYIEFILGSMIFYILAPIFEELYFRGYIQSLFEKNACKTKWLNAFMPIFFTALLFGLYHGHFSKNTLSAFIKSFIFYSYLMHRSKSIYATMTAHFSINFFVTIAGYILSRYSFFFFTSKNDLIIANLELCLIGITVFTILLVFSIIRILQQSKQEVMVVAANSKEWIKNKFPI